MTITTMGDITRYYRDTMPHKVALTYAFDNRQWTYKQLDDESCQCANALKSMGIGHQDRAAILDKNTPEYFTYLFGINKLNAISVAVNWRLAPPEIEYILNHSEAKVLLIGEEFLGHLKQMNLNLKQIVVLGDPGESPYPSYSQWIAGQSIADILTPVDPQDACYQLYTSGTTGLPKGVEISHTNMMSCFENGLRAVQLNENSVNLVCMPLFHISGSGWGLLSIHAGASTILMHEPDMQEILQNIPKYDVTHAFFVPSVLQLLLAQPNIDAIDFSSLSSITYGASPITEQVLVKAIGAFGAEFFQVYGLTETTGAITLLPAEDHDPDGPRAGLLRSCGKAVAHHEIKIIDTESLAPVADGAVGEIWLKGPQVMIGYWRDDEATRASISADGWFRSGDIGYLIEGYLYVHDRVKDMIISGGENIYPAEIENVLMKLAGVTDVAVIGVPDARWGESVKAIITLAEDTLLTEESVMQHCRKQLAHYKCPTSITWMSAIPRNPSGKILKTELRKPYWAGRERNVS